MGDNFTRNRALVERIEAIADGKGITASQLALAWVMAQGEDVVPIPGTRSSAHLEANVAAVDVELTPDDISALEDVVPPGAVSGDRYSDMSSVNR
jgi:aryl-alcohol dehydrogenase-like predicted oxidoreductase